MPQYDYRCPKCQWCGERLVRRIVDADTQVCGRPTDDDDTHTCDGELVRDGVSLTASMGYNWGNWQ